MTPFDDSRATWTNADEIEYLRHIGTYSARRDIDRQTLLRGYLAALRLRARSSRYLDMEKLRERAEELLQAND
jgi:hypothetical protein